MVSGSTGYAFLGWQGWGLEHPADWELTRVRGSRRESYLALDDGERIRLEMSWKPVRRKLPLEKLVEKQVKAVELAARGRKLDVRIRRRQGIRRLAGFQYECFTWQTGVPKRGVPKPDEVGLGSPESRLGAPDVGSCELVARCRDCGRVILLRVVGDKDRPPMEEARRVFASLTCYSGKEFERWGTFGLDVKVPAGFELEGSSLRTGMCELVFSDRRTELHVMRVSLGRAILERQKMVAWYESVASQLLKPFVVTWSERPFRFHIGHAGVGEVRTRYRLMSVFRSTRKLSVRLFYCEPMDKIFVVAADGSGDVDKVVETALEGLVCHR